MGWEVSVKINQPDVVNEAEHEHVKWMFAIRHVDLNRSGQNINLWTNMAATSVHDIIMCVVYS